MTDNTQKDWITKTLDDFKESNTSLGVEVINEAEKLARSSGMRDRDLKNTDLVRMSKHFLKKLNNEESKSEDMQPNDET